MENEEKQTASASINCGHLCSVCGVRAYEEKTASWFIFFLVNWVIVYVVSASVCAYVRVRVLCMHVVYAKISWRHPKLRPAVESLTSFLLFFLWPFILHFTNPCNRSPYECAVECAALRYIQLHWARCEIKRIEKKKIKK